MSRFYVLLTRFKRQQDKKKKKPFFPAFSLQPLFLSGREGCKGAEATVEPKQPTSLCLAPTYLLISSRKEGNSCIDLTYLKICVRKIFNLSLGCCNHFLFKNRYSKNSISDDRIRPPLKVQLKTGMHCVV